MIGRHSCSWLQVVGTSQFVVSPIHLVLIICIGNLVMELVSCTVDQVLFHLSVFDFVMLNLNIP